MQPNQTAFDSNKFVAFSIFDNLCDERLCRNMIVMCFNSIEDNVLVNLRNSSFIQVGFDECGAELRMMFLNFSLPLRIKHGMCKIQGNNNQLFISVVSSSKFTSFFDSKLSKQPGWCFIYISLLTHKFSGV